jgi:hypothetical protein
MLDVIRQLWTNVVFIGHECEIVLIVYSPTKLLMQVDNNALDSGAKHATPRLGTSLLDPQVIKLYEISFPFLGWSFSLTWMLYIFFSVCQ